MENLIQLLTASIDDQTFDTEEKHQLANAITIARLNEDQYRRLRNEAFKLAKRRLDSNNAYRLMKWLEKVVKLLDTTRPIVSNAEAFFSPGQDCLAEISEQLNKAKNFLDICVYTITDNRIRKIIIAAAQRGVYVRIITDNDKALDSGSDIAMLSKQNLHIRLDKTNHHMHHKFALVDGKILINGSFNWTRSATDHNHENIVVANNAALVTQFQQEFDRLWLYFQ